MDYLVQIIGHIDARKRPRGQFPKQVIQEFTTFAETRKELADMVEQATKVIIMMQGMAVRKKTGSMVDMTTFDLGRMFVPMHMITHLTANVVTLTGEIPTFDKDGKLTNKDGSEVLLN